MKYDEKYRKKVLRKIIYYNKPQSPKSIHTNDNLRKKKKKKRVIHFNNYHKIQ